MENQFNTLLTYNNQSLPNFDESAIDALSSSNTSGQLNDTMGKPATAGRDPLYDLSLDNAKVGTVNPESPATFETNKSADSRKSAQKADLSKMP